MNISINSSVISGRFGDQKAIRLIAEAGFDAVDYTFADYFSPSSPWQLGNKEDYALNLLETAKMYGVTFNQAHAVYLYPWDEPDVTERLIIPTVQENLRLCQIMKIDRIVVHGLSHPAVMCTKEEQFEHNIRFYTQLKEASRKTGVKIALENLRKVCTTPDEYLKLFEALNDPCFTACVDIGHTAVAGVDTAQLIRQLGHDRLTLLHVHDNLAGADDHMLPGTGLRNWEPVLQALADIRYNGDFTLEILDHVSGILDGKHGFDDDFVPIMLKFACALGRYLAGKLKKMSL